MQGTLPTSDDVLTFWFGRLDDSGLVQPNVAQRWWTKNPDFDAEIRNKFGDLHRALSSDELQVWSSEPVDALARIIVLDQFSRNLYRGTPAMVAQDGVALAIAKVLVKDKSEQAFPFAWRSFVYMPYEHSEEIEDQQRSVALFELMRDDANASGNTEAEKFSSNSLEFAVQHQKIIERFGRFPHRNAFLQRKSTPEELAFLEQPGSSF